MKFTTSTLVLSCLFATSSHAFTTTTSTTPQQRRQPQWLSTTTTTARHVATEPHAETSTSMTTDIGDFFALNRPKKTREVSIVIVNAWLIDWIMYILTHSHSHSHSYLYTIGTPRGRLQGSSSSRGGIIDSSRPS